MGSEMKVEVIAKETVKPSSPTPHPFPTYSLSVYDQAAPDFYVRLLIFYPSNSTTDQKVDTVDHQYHSSITTERSKLLKTSLSETLSRFYPFAGTFFHHNNVPSICCDDKGAAFVQTRVNCPISMVLGNYHPESLNQLLPNAMESKFESTGHLLLVQANFFECGGLAIGISIAHKVADGFTLGTFIRTWAEMSLGSDILALPAVEFGFAPSVHPPQPLVINSSQTTISFEFVHEDGVVTRRFVFDASKIASLKSMAASDTVRNPTRTEVVTALIWKCAMEASKSNLGYTRPSLMTQAVNMRKQMGQPNLIGNLVGFFPAMTYQGELNLQGLVAQLRIGLDEFRVNYRKGFTADDIREGFKKLGIQNGRDISEIYKFASWCRFGFYEADFGWGKPSWVSNAGGPFKNQIVLLDTKGGEGIEAILSFKEDDMAVIETNKELLAHASLN